jgi:hypothetical protein
LAPSPTRNETSENRTRPSGRTYWSPDTSTYPTPASCPIGGPAVAAI